MSHNYGKEIFEYDDISKYKTKLNPIKSAVEQTVTYVSKIKGISKEEAIEIVRNKNKDKIKDPTITFNKKQPNEDMAVVKGKLSEYIKSNINENNIIMPSLTTYVQKTKGFSIFSGFVSSNVQKRNYHKAREKAAEAAKDYRKAVGEKILNNSYKTYNNSATGGFGSPGTIMYNPPSHYTTTSLTRGMASIGNSITESMVAGNRHYDELSNVLNHIVAIITYMDTTAVEKAVTTFNIHLPTVDEVVDVIKRSTSLYWRSKSIDAKIRELLDTLTPLELAAVAYSNDLYHMKKLNDGLIREMLHHMSAYVLGDPLDTSDILFKTEPYILNLAHHICLGDMRGKELDYRGLRGTPVYGVLIGTVNNILRTLEHYKPLIRGFFITEIMTIDMVDIKRMTRRSITVSDTDSTCGAYDHWSSWFFDDKGTIDDYLSLTAAVMTITTATMDHYLKIYTGNMNYPIEDIGKLKMKNEYSWPVMITSRMTKHYYALVYIREMIVLDKAKLELKGKHFLVSDIPEIYKSKATGMITKILNTLSSGKKLKAVELIKEVADMERELIELINKGDISIYLTEKIKDKKAYAGNWVANKYFSYVLWDTVFKDKYGDPGVPELLAVKIPMALEKKSDLYAFIEDIKDENIRVKLSEFMTKHRKTSMTTFRLPHSIAITTGVIEELIGGIDKHKTVHQIMAVFYLILESIGVYNKKKTLLIDLGY